ncbi:MAG: amidohydrolase family protein, partial [Clostridia bacterium]|nr:amidohydrolase family protein [Clostridia bacterium]
MNTQYRLQNCLLITESGIEEKDLLLKNGKIQALIPRDRAASPDYRPLDCGGRYVSPGFVDIHQHGGGGSDYMDEDPNAYLNATEAHLAHGTTSVMPTLLSADTNALLQAVKRYRQADQSGKIRANLLGLHV